MWNMKDKVVSIILGTLGNVLKTQKKAGLVELKIMEMF